MFFAFGVFAGCAGPYTITGENLLIEMQKTSCRGECPVYTLRIGKNGKGLFEGVEYIQPLGIYKFRLNREELDALHQSFDASGFFELENIYTKPVMDTPTTYISYREDGRYKRIMDHYGAPQKLKQLEQQIESLVLSVKFKEVRKR